MPSQTLTCSPCCSLDISQYIPHAKTDISSLIGSFIEPMDYTMSHLKQFIVVQSEENFFESPSVSLQLMTKHIRSKPYNRNLGLIERLICQKMDEGLRDFICALLIKIAKMSQSKITFNRKPAHSKNFHSFFTLVSSSIKIPKESPLLPLLDSLSMRNSIQTLFSEMRLWTCISMDSLEDFVQQKEKNLEREDSWQDKDIENCEAASTASASSRSIEIREDLNALFMPSSSLEDFSEDLVLDRAVVSEQNQPSKVQAKEMFSYYDGFDIGDLSIPFDSNDKMLCMAKGPVQEKKLKNKFLSLNSTRRTNTYSNSPCSSPAYSDGPISKQLGNQHSKFMRPQQNGSRSNFMTSGNSTFWKKQSNSCFGEQRKAC